MRRLTYFILLTVLATGAVFALSGCANIAEKATQAAVEKATGVKVDSENKTITATDDQGNTTELSSQEGKYPDSFPSDFPQYPSGTVESAITGSANGQESFTVVVKTPDAPADVYEWYQAELETAGWKVEQKMDTTTPDGAFSTVAAVKGDQRAGVTITKGSDETETSIMIVIGSESQ